jgi:predicted enzyme involved in methoxymalonyl-ACP biosynthesis
MALSCAVLAKQVEHAVLAALIKIAAGRACRQLEFQYRASERNQPMLGFLMAVAGNATDGKYVLPLDVAEARLNAAAVSAGAWTVEISRDLENSSVHQDDLG